MEFRVSKEEQICQRENKEMMELGIYLKFDQGENKVEVMELGIYLKFDQGEDYMEMMELGIYLKVDQGENKGGDGAGNLSEG
jgi:hypothetical protein